MKKKKKNIFIYLLFDKLKNINKIIVLESINIIMLERLRFWYRKSK
jgi:hypothetical protein